MARRGRKPCRRCQWIRLYLVTAGGLLGLMIVAPDLFVQMGRRLPSPMAIAAIIPIIGVPAFLMKYALWRQEIRREKELAEQAEG